jgi:hypothetical protein
MLVLLLALLTPSALAGGLDGEAGVCLLRPHRAPGQQVDWVVWLADSQIGMLRNQTYYCFKAEPGVLEVEVTETSTMHIEPVVVTWDPVTGTQVIPSGEEQSYWRTRAGTLEIEAMPDETVFYTVRRKKKSFRFDEVDRETFERLDLASSR